MKTSQLATQFAQQWKELRANRRLQLGLLAILAIIFIDGGLRWLDHLQASENLLGQLRNQRLQLQGRSQDENSLHNQLKELEQIRSTAETRMWIVPSDAIGQALQKDWLQSMFKEARIVPQSITLASPRAPSGKTSRPESSSADIPQTLPGAPTVREFRATLTFPFAPEALEKVLAALEGGEPFVQIEALNASRKDRRIELTLNMQMEVDKIRAQARAKNQELRAAEQPVESN